MKCYNYRKNKINWIKIKITILEQIQSYNFTKNVVVLKNGEEFKDISRSKRRELYNRVRGVG